MQNNKINFCTLTGDNCSWCEKRVYDYEQNIIKIHCHDDYDNIVITNENNEIEIYEMFHQKCWNEKINFKPTKPKIKKYKKIIFKNEQDKWNEFKEKLIKEKSLQFLYDELDLSCSNDYQDKKSKKVS
ncbi:hypothetical protein [Spiroplasma ixodetis]|uniref:Uncharacterized protein n=1 Tax=Spiroplasma ixodetis TaxID=2141 RepID=A0ABM8JQF5_9MOLU